MAGGPSHEPDDPYGAAGPLPHRPPQHSEESVNPSGQPLCRGAPILREDGRRLACEEVRRPNRRVIHPSWKQPGQGIPSDRAGSHLDPSWGLGGPSEGAMLKLIPSHRLVPRPREVWVSVPRTGIGRVTRAAENSGSGDTFKAP